MDLKVTPEATPDVRSIPPATPTRSWGLWLESFIERLFITFCIYTLSIGPLYWEYINARHAHGYLLLAAFYEPLRLLGEAFPLFGECLNWYISLWVG